MASVVGRTEPVFLVKATSKRMLRQNRQGKKSTASQNSGTCKNCGWKWSADHRIKFPASDQVCKPCGKKNHFARVFRSKKIGYKARIETSNRAVNIIEENKNQLENTTDVHLVHNSDVNSSYTDSDENYYVNMISKGNDSPNKSVDEIGDPKHLFVKLGNSEFNIVVEAVSVICLVTERIAQEIESHHSSA